MNAFHSCELWCLLGKELGYDFRMLFINSFIGLVSDFHLFIGRMILLLSYSTIFKLAAFDRLADFDSVTFGVSKCKSLLQIILPYTVFKSVLCLCVYFLYSEKVNLCNWITSLSSAETPTLVTFISSRSYRGCTGS